MAVLWKVFNLIVYSYLNVNWDRCPFEFKRAMNVPIGYLQTKIIVEHSVGTHFLLWVILLDYELAANTKTTNTHHYALNTTITLAPLLHLLLEITMICRSELLRCHYSNHHQITQRVLQNKVNENEFYLLHFEI
jgi:hypothetical protein